MRCEVKGKGEKETRDTRRDKARHLGNSSRQQRGACETIAPWVGAPNGGHLRPFTSMPSHGISRTTTLAALRREVALSDTVERCARCSADS